MSNIWTLWRGVAEWLVASQERAIENARTGATELSRRRVEREDVELFLAGRSEGVRREGAG